MLSPRTLQESSGGFDRSHSAFLWQDELFEFGTKVRCPSIGCVNDRSRSHFSPIGVDSDPAIAMFFRDVQDWSVCLEVQVAFLEQLPQEGVDELICPSVD